jgi:hypothetical protein
MSKRTYSSRRIQTRSSHLPIAPTELQRLRTRLHTGEHIVLNQHEADTILQIVDLITPTEPAIPSVRRPKPSYHRQQHRPVCNNRST